VTWCYSVAQEGAFQGELGYELIKVVDSSPGIGPLVINDQFAEEAFTVYDHPKVFIFKKSAGYDPQQVREILGRVDLAQAVHITPRRVGSFPANLMLPQVRWDEQRQGGTWSELFDTGAVQNRFQIVGVLFWYLSLALLGWIVYPLLRAALPGLADYGFPMARAAGLLLLSYLVWLAGSFRVPASRLTIGLILAGLALFGIFLAFRQRQELRLEWRQRRVYFLLVEGLFLAFFAFDLLIRFGNPDLWHPYHGGEKPMDFAYFNAVLKSTSFPPYDPWFAGGYLNYYYYGFVLVGVLVKLLGIVPSVAYNLILPTIFSMAAMGAFSVVWNLAEGRRTNDERRSSNFVLRPSSFVTAVAGALGMAVLGNLGIIRMVLRGFQMLAAPGGALEGGGLLIRLIWTAQGFLRSLAGAPLPYGPGDWYWLPSRAIPAPGDVEPITEFPFFTVLYGDPHAHLFALPITLLVLAFALSVLLGRARWRSAWGAAAGFFLGGLAIGALRPTNTWDFYPYLPLAGVVVGYAIWTNTCSGAATISGPGRASSWLSSLPLSSRRLLVTVGGVLLLAFLSLALFQPYAQWYGQGYSKVALWRGTHTSPIAYFTHWGLFLFLIVSWMAWETREWLASTPVSSLRKLEPYRGWIQAGLAFLAVLVLGLLVLKVGIAWLVLPLAAWAGALILRPGQPDAKRFVLFLVGTGLVLTLMVEVVVLVGDIGRMNTVFKFYLQVWTLFSVSAAAALGWLLDDLILWKPRWRAVWQVALAALLISAGLYPFMASMAKVKNRAAPQAPHTLDGMAYMDYAEYQETWGVLDLSQDYPAIRWMQENVQGSPVIVEANQRNLYRWGSRFSIYTGLPGVAGWEWHQQQQRALLPGSLVTNRILEIDQFYQTTDLQQAHDFLRKYEVGYIVLGQQERGQYPGPGLDKFPAANGSLWREVYNEGDTTIYEVIE
jgi:YYY domain-containing protein